MLKSNLNKIDININNDQDYKGDFSALNDL